MRYKPLTDYSDITPFARCPSCNQLIKLKSFTDAVMEGERDCPFCHSFIGKKEFVSSCEMYLITTKAVQSAQDVFDIYWSLLLILGEILLGTAFSFVSELGKYNFLFFMATIIAGLMLFGGFSMTYNWLSKFGKIQTTDEEFIAVKKKVRHAQTIWVWANIANLIWLLIYIKCF